MLERIAIIEAEYAEIEARLADPKILGDQALLESVGRRYKELEEVVRAGRQLRQAHDDHLTAQEMIMDSDGDDREELRVEIAQLEKKYSYP